MDSKSEQLKLSLDNNQELCKHLFEKGFLITDTVVADLNIYPFYGNWTQTRIGSYSVYVHNEAHLYVVDRDGVSYFLIGHAYNPFSMETSETTILEKIAESKESRPNCIDELTGVFILGRISGSQLQVELDCSGMQYGCYGVINGAAYIASHMQLIGDVCGLQQDDYVKRLVNYRWYNYMMGNYLPGELTCFKEAKRIIPNTYVTYQNGNFSVTRFYPNREIKPCQTKEEYDLVIAEASKIMQATMALIPQKWVRPAISLTGGIDSNTTFAAANGNYDHYQTFSYVAMARESVDAEAAETIAQHFQVPHKTYQIPESNDAVPDFELYKKIFIHNDGEIGRAKDDDTRKKIALINQDVCDVEVKSWISETIRAYAYKYFGRTKFPKHLRPRHYTSLYKIFFMNRRLAVETDRYFDQYIKNTDLKAHLYNYDESDFFVWEMMHGGKCGLNIGVMKLCFDITIPYNNRRLLDLLLRVPLDKRISDQHHLDLKKTMNPELYDMNIRVINLNETKRRKQFANLYFTVNSLLPF